MKQQHGFTLIEVLITMAIFSIGILALAAMQISGMSSNQFARTLATASTLAGDKIERMTLTDSDHTSLDAGTAHSETYTEGQISYTVNWTVTDDLPATGSKTVNIEITWHYGDKNRKLNVTYIKGNRGAS
ncbi:type IV pilus modification protein PilV [Desulfococcaceae bacterium HSG9]|nr:type IV pilus modification protein PilV [Desulfococcaceae bacterium HSG9]